MLLIFSTKSKWYFVLPVLVLLMLDQVLKKEYDWKLSKAAQDDNEKEKKEKDLLAWHTNLNNQLNVLIITVIVVGMLHYMWLQRVEYGPEFSLATFFFGVNKRCKPFHPDYKKMMPRSNSNAPKQTSVK